jgi:hypothetical protein
MTDPTEQVLTAAANDDDLSDGAFILIRRALAGLDPITGEKPVPALPKRMSQRGWRRGVMDRVEVGQGIGWYWRCPRRKSCGAWGGPFAYEHEAVADGRAAHHDAHVASRRD